jgi:hypothetical protein
MKKLITCGIIWASMFQLSFAQEWLTSFEAAKRLAAIQDKLIIMVWEETSLYQYPVLIIYENDKVQVQNLFNNEPLNSVLWEHFIPVIVPEYNYDQLYATIKGKRAQAYIDKFNDDSIKVMDSNGNIINTSYQYDEYLDIVKFIKTYALNTSFLKPEITTYSEQNNLYTTLRLATKYIDYAIFVNEVVRPEIIKLSTIYLNETEAMIIDSEHDDKDDVLQRVSLLKLKQELILNKPKKVLRQLKRIDDVEIKDTNQEYVDFLYYTSYLLLKDENNASVWRSKLSLLNLKKANLIITNIL